MERDSTQKTCTARVSSFVIRVINILTGAGGGWGGEGGERANLVSPRSELAITVERVRSAKPLDYGAT